LRNRPEYNLLTCYFCGRILDGGTPYSYVKSHEFIGSQRYTGVALETRGVEYSMTVPRCGRCRIIHIAITTGRIILVSGFAVFMMVWAFTNPTLTAGPNYGELFWTILCTILLCVLIWFFSILPGRLVAWIFGTQMKF
jgi:hypothetical protein